MRQSMRQQSAIVSSLCLGLVAATVSCGEEDEIVPEGEHYQYVVSKVAVPQTAAEANKFGIDIDGAADKRVDNQLGQILSFLKTNGVDTQTTLNDSVNQGDVVLLLDLQTKDFTSAAATGLKVLLGDVGSPAACTDPATVATCGQHLKGGASFTISANSPTGAKVAGPVVGGTFKGGPGTISIKFALTEGAAPLQLDLIGARAQLSGMSATGIATGVLAGAIKESDINDKILPTVSSQIDVVVAKDCTAPTAPPACGCVGSGKQIVDLFDTNDDCKVSLEEVKDSAIKDFLQPDVTINGTRALSLGVSISAVKASFPAQ